MYIRNEKIQTLIWKILILSLKPLFFAILSRYSEILAENCLFTLDRVAPVPWGRSWNPVIPDSRFLRLLEPESGDGLAFGIPGYHRNCPSGKRPSMVPTVAIQKCHNRRVGCMIHCHVASVLKLERKLDI